MVRGLITENPVCDSEDYYEGPVRVHTKASVNCKWNALVTVHFMGSLLTTTSQLLTTLSPNGVVVAGATHGKATLSATQQLEMMPL